MKPNIKIRLAKPGDREAMFSVTTSGWLDTYPNKELGITEEAIKEQLIRKNNNKKPIMQTATSRTWVALDGEKIVGFCRAQLDEGKNYLGATYILKDYRREGIGSRFLNKVIAWFGENSEVVTDVASYNEKAINFYKKHGFLVVGPSRKPKTTMLPNGAIIPIVRMIRK